MANGREHRNDEKERTMKTIYFASVCGVTLLAITSFANAQGTGVGSNSRIKVSRPSNAGM
jgi:hypothetical protein